jgi:hypothetical protein
MMPQVRVPLRLMCSAPIVPFGVASDTPRRLVDLEGRRLVFKIRGRGNHAVLDGGLRAVDRLALVEKVEVFDPEYRFWRKVPGRKGTQSFPRASSASRPVSTVLPRRQGSVIPPSPAMPRGSLSHPAAIGTSSQPGGARIEATCGGVRLQRFPNGYFHRRVRVVFPLQ